MTRPLAFSLSLSCMAVAVKIEEIHCLIYNPPLLLTSLVVMSHKDSNVKECKDIPVFLQYSQCQYVYVRVYPVKIAVARGAAAVHVNDHMTFLIIMSWQLMAINIYQTTNRENRTIKQRMPADLYLI